MTAVQSFSVPIIARPIANQTAVNTNRIGPIIKTPLVNAQTREVGTERKLLLPAFELSRVGGATAGVLAP